MFGYDTRLTTELEDHVLHLEGVARKAGLDPFPTIFELVDYKQVNEIAAYGGFPTRYPHWRWGMEYERISKSYSYGLSIIYEMVINNNPCYAYLLRGNSMVFQKTVIAHVYGHSDFFKHNYWFSKTNRKMLDQMANHAGTVRKIINKLGHDKVEDFIDVCLSLDNLIDMYAPFSPEPKKPTDSELAMVGSDSVPKLQAKRKYMDSYLNPDDFIAEQKAKQVEKMKEMERFPSNPERDVLSFLINHAPLNQWEKAVLTIIRDEAYYFLPQGQTKIINEGWATYWHSKMMTQLAPLDDSEIVDYCDHFAGVVASQPGGLNPYKLGVELLRYIEKRWNEGKYGLDYLNCDDYKTRQAWNKETGKGIEKLFEVRSIHNDITFLDEFLDEDFCHMHKMFIYHLDKRTGKYIITSKDFPKIKQNILNQLTNFGQPIIEVIDANYKNRGELLLKHKYEKVGLRKDYAVETCKNLYRVWKRPVNIETLVDEKPSRIIFDGKSHNIEKA